MRLPFYPGRLRHVLLEAVKAEREEARHVASAAEGQGVLADLAAEGWLEMG